jgi:hypothetical protein
MRNDAVDDAALGAAVHAQRQRRGRIAFRKPATNKRTTSSGRVPQAFRETTAKKRMTKSDKNAAISRHPRQLKVRSSSRL